MNNDTRKSNIYTLNYPKYVKISRKHWVSTSTVRKMKWTKSTSYI
jgi:hypothetical protein